MFQNIRQCIGYNLCCCLLLATVAVADAPGKPLAAVIFLLAAAASTFTSCSKKEGESTLSRVWGTTSCAFLLACAVLMAFGLFTQGNAQNFLFSTSSVFATAGLIMAWVHPVERKKARKA